MGNGFIDKYSYLHFATGIISYFFDISFFNWFILHTIFEIIENTDIGIKFINRYLIFWPGGKEKPDSFINNIGDTIFALVGWISAYIISNL